MVPRAYDRVDVQPKSSAEATLEGMKVFDGGQRLFPVPRNAPDPVMGFAVSVQRDVEVEFFDPGICVKRFFDNVEDPIFDQPVSRNYQSPDPAVMGFGAAAA